jgi:hypothetical protein
MGSKTEYALAQHLARKPKLITRINREPGKPAELINLAGKKVTEKVTPLKGGPPMEVSVRGATQSDLKYLYEEAPGDWSNIIVKVTVKVTSKGDESSEGLP